MPDNPWDAFGSESDEDEAPSVHLQRPPPVPGVAPNASHTRPRAKTRRMWDTLLPSFVGAPDSIEAAHQSASSQPIRSASYNTIDSGKRLSLPVETGDDPITTAGRGQEGRQVDKDVGDDEGDQRAARAPFSAPPLYQHPAMLYNANMPNRGGGRGFVAAADISPGTLLLAEKRFLPMPTAMDCGRAGGIGQEELCLKWILALPPAKLEEILEEMRWLHPQSLDALQPDEVKMLLAINEEVAEAMIAELGPKASKRVHLDPRAVVRLLGALQSNGFSSGIYLHSAMTNHSCRPNAIKWQAGRSISASNGRRGWQGPQEKTDGVAGAVGGHDEGKISEIRATEFIRKGEEITVSYLEPREIALASRQSRLKEQFGFDCDCRLCCESNTATVATSWALEAYDKGEGKQANSEEMGTNALNGDRRHRGEKGVGDGKEKETGDGVADADTRRWREREREHAGAMVGGVAAIEEDEDDLDTRGLITVSLLERRLEATESVLDLLRPKEVRWPGVLSEVLGYRRQASRSLFCRHIALARADKVIAKACSAILQGPIETAESDADCVKSVRQASDGLPASFGGALLRENSEILEGGFKTRLLAVFLASLLSRRKTQLLYLGDAPHPEAGACLADLSQAMRMLLAQGSEGGKWIRQLPGDDPSLSRKYQGGAKGIPGILAQCEQSQSEGWWEDGIAGASVFEQACQKAAGRVGRLFGDPRKG